jgi:hypothetical protein
MKDKKLPDSEIVKALEYCSQQGITSECERCKVKGCRSELIKLALDLINRQNAKIDYQEAEINLLRDESAKANVENVRLNDTLDVMVLEHKRLMKTVKADAYKEFANEFGNMLWQMKTESLQQGDTEYASALVIIHTKLAKFLKEMS